MYYLTFSPHKILKYVYKHVIFNSGNLKIQYWLKKICEMSYSSKINILGSKFLDTKKVILCIQVNKEDKLCIKFILSYFLFVCNSHNNISNFTQHICITYFVLMILHNIKYYFRNISPHIKELKSI